MIRYSCFNLFAAAVVMGVACGLANAQDFPSTNPIPGIPPATGFQLKLEDVIEIPRNRGSRPRLELLTHLGDGSGRLYVADQLGMLYSFLPGDTEPSIVLDVDEHAPGFLRTGGQKGFRSFAFHPNYATAGTPGFGKLYTAYSARRTTGGDHDSVVAEWTLADDGTVDTAIAPREILRVQQPRGDHNIGRIGFNPNLNPGDADYGNLYIAFGDGGNYRTDRGDDTLNPNGQDTTNLLGSMLRLDPTTPDADAGTAYTVPADNPFVDDDNILSEIWAYGLRNPHTFGWDSQSGKMLIGDIGQSGLEEVNLGASGANYGWPLREGTFSVEGKRPLSSSPIAVDELPADHPTDPYTYPVAQYDHDPGDVGNDIGNAAIVGGFVSRNSRVPQLDGKYLFGDFANNTGPIFVVDETDLEQREDFTDLASLSGGYLAPFEELSLLDENDQPATLLDIIRDASNNSRLGRTDLRFGQGEDGEVYVLNKQDSRIRRFAVVPEPTSISLIAFGVAGLLIGRHRTIRRP